MKIMLVAAMPTESLDIVEKFKMQLVGKFADTYPYYSTYFEDKEVFLLQTHVGSINAPAATALAINTLKPDYVVKVGCVGGNAPGIKANDIIVPTSFFHSGAWMTRSYKDNTPTANSALWQSLYGDLPYQNNKENLGDVEYTFLPDQRTTEIYRKLLIAKSLPYKEAPLGGGDMVIFSRELMDNIRVNILQANGDSFWCTDNESHAIAQICSIYKKPFTGIYFVASSDCEDIDGYDPDAIRKQIKETILPLLGDFLKFA